MASLGRRTVSPSQPSIQVLSVLLAILWWFFRFLWGKRGWTQSWDTRWYWCCCILEESEKNTTDTLNPKTMKPLKIHTRIHMKVMATGGGIAAMVLNAWKGHLLTRRQREQLYATGSAFGKKIRHDFDDALDDFLGDSLDVFLLAELFGLWFLDCLDGYNRLQPIQK